jgi:multisubunit Na+/H+ antiporter MnhG subunit
MTPARELSNGRRVALILMVWAFMVVFAAAYTMILWPRMVSGHVLAVFLGIFVTAALISFALAAVSFSRDVVSGRYPGERG